MSNLTINIKISDGEVFIFNTLQFTNKAEQRLEFQTLPWNASFQLDSFQLDFPTMIKQTIINMNDLSC